MAFDESDGGDVAIDLLGEMESQEEDEELLKELAAKRRARQKTFLSVINKKKLGRHELDEVML